MNPAAAEGGLFERTHRAGCNCDNKDEVLSANLDLLDGVEGPPPAVEPPPARGICSLESVLMTVMSYAAAMAEACIAVAVGADAEEGSKLALEYNALAVNTDELGLAVTVVSLGMLEVECLPLRPDDLLETRFRLSMSLNRKGVVP